MRTLKDDTGRVLRDIPRQADASALVRVARGLDTRGPVSRPPQQTPGRRGTLDALHAPEVGGMSKGKARVRPVFGTKGNAAVAAGFVTGRRVRPGAPCDGPTPAEALEQADLLTDTHQDLAVVGRGDRGHGAGKTRLLISGASFRALDLGPLILDRRRGVTPALRHRLCHRGTIEPEPSHTTLDGRLTRRLLTGAADDAIRAVLCGCGHTIRKTLARPWAF
ncbi:MAG: hypothetical protein AAGB05_12970 [Pseudomonadota bacterium]